MKKIIYVVFLWSGLLFAQKQVSNAAFGEMLANLLQHSVHEVLPNEIEDTTSVLFLDAREKKEFKVSHIKNATWVGYSTFKLKRVKNIAKDTPIVVYCTVGYRSEKVAEQLKEAGFSNVSNLYGGIFEWMHQHKKIHCKNQDIEETENVHTFDEEWSQWLQNGKKVF